MEQSPITTTVVQGGACVPFDGLGLPAAKHDFVFAKRSDLLLWDLWGNVDLGRLGTFLVGALSIFGVHTHTYTYTHACTVSYDFRFISFPKH